MLSTSFQAHEIKCGSWLACDSGESEKNVVTDPPLSQASQLPHRYVAPLRSDLPLELQQRNRIADKNPVLIELVIAEVPAHGRVAPLHIEVLQRTALHRVGQLRLTPPFLAVGDRPGVYVAAADIAVHQGQPRNPEHHKVKVMAHLPGLFLGVVVAGVVAVVGQGAAAGAVDAHPGAVATEFLQANVEGVAVVFG